MRKIERLKRVARDVSEIGGHRLGAFKQTSETSAVAHCKLCGAEARVNTNPPSFPITLEIEGDATASMRCGYRLERGIIDTKYADPKYAQVREQARRREYS